MQHALTIDLEDWHQLLHRRTTGDLIPASLHVVPDTHRLLDLLEDAGVRATFFTLGMVAEQYPQLVQEVARRGHEIGSHSYRHQLIASMTRQEFRQEMDRSVKQLEDLTGSRVRGFRAPEFSVGNTQHWCFEVLSEAGIEYDSSVFPVHGARYGIPNAPSVPFDIQTASGRVREFPLATWRAGGVNVPVAGGTYYRILPEGVLRRALAQMQAAGRTIVLYFHPYEFHTGRLSLPSLNWRQKLRAPAIKYTLLHNFFTSLISQRLRLLLGEFRFGPLGDLTAA